MIKDKFYILVISSYLVSYFSILVRFLQHDLNINQSFDSFFFNSDAVFFGTFAKDVILNNENFSNWMLAGAPEIFPTIFFSFLIPFIIKNYFISQIIFVIIQLVIFNILFISIINFFTEKRYAMISGVLLNVILIFFLFEKPYNYIFLASHHFGCFLNFLICVLFVLYKGIDKIINSTFLCFLLFFFTFSNPILITYFVIPLVLCLQFFSTIKGVTLKNISFIISAFSGYYLKKNIYFHNCGDCINTYQTMDNIYFDSIFISLYHIKAFFFSLGNFIQNFIVLLTLIIFIIYSVKFFLKSKTKNQLQNKEYLIIFFLFLSSSLTVISFLFLHMNPHFRHLYTLYFSIFMIIPIISFKHIKNLIRTFKNRIILCLFGITLLLSFVNFDGTKKINFEYYPKDIHFIDKVLYKYNLNHGYAKWEYCNRLIFLSKRNLTVLPYHKKKPLHWDTNIKWNNKKPQFLINLDPNNFGYKKFITITDGNINIHIL